MALDRRSRPSGDGWPNEAKELVAEELDQARRGHITTAVIRNLRILGLIERGQRGIDLLSDAVTIGADGPARLEYVHALIDLGGIVAPGKPPYGGA